MAAHNRKHGVDSTDDHTGISGATENNIATLDANGLPKDSGVPITGAGGDMQDAYDSDADILFSKNMTWDLNEAYSVTFQEGTQSLAIGATAANELTVSANVQSVDVDSVDNVTINNNPSGDSWTEINGVYYCPAGGNALEQLLLYMKNTSNKGGTIILAEGDHLITWTTSTPIDEAVHIIGPGHILCRIRFTAGDPDCRFVFTYRAIIEGVQIMASNGAANCVTFSGTNANYSIIRNCYLNNLSNLTGSAIAVTSCIGVRIENILFSDMNTASSRVFYIGSSTDTIIRGCYCGNVRNTQLLYVTGACNGLIFEGNHFVAGGTRQCCQIYISYSGPQNIVITKNYIDYSATPISSAFNLIDFGDGGGASYGRHIFTHNHIKCVRSSSNWYAGANILHVNVRDCIIAKNKFETAYIGYTNTQIGRIIHVERYGQDADISNNKFIGGGSRNGIYLDCAAANTPEGCQIQNNKFRGFDHDGTGVGACIEVDDGALAQGVRSAIITGNYLGGSSNIYAVYAPGGGGSVAPTHCVISNNIIGESAIPIDAADFYYSSIQNNNREGVDSTAGTSVSGSNTNNVYGDDGAGNPSTTAPGANQ